MSRVAVTLIVVLCAVGALAARNGVDLSPTEDKEYQLELSGAAFAARFNSRRDGAIGALYALLGTMDATQPLPFPFHFKSPSGGTQGELRAVAFLDTPEGHFANRTTHLRYRQVLAEPNGELTWKFETQDRDVAKSEPMAVDKSIASKSERKTEQNLNSAVIWTPNWYQAATTVPVKSGTFPPTEFRTINDLEDFFPDIGTRFGVSSSHPIVIKAVTYQFNTAVKMGLASTTVKGGFQFTYNSKADFANNATVPGFEFTFKLARESGKDWDPQLIRNGLGLLSYLETTFPLALHWTRCVGNEPVRAVE